MDLSADITCPSCEKQFEVKLRDMRPGNSASCPHCDASIKFEGDDASNVQNAVDDLEREFKRLSQRFGSN